MTRLHVLLTNDDGPPGEFSPYIHYLVEAIRKYTDWELSIAVPHVQRSWIGKAHIMGADIVASYCYAGSNPREDEFDGPHPTPQPNKDNKDEWVLLNGTPASCANIGIHHLFAEKGPVDLVISGPNFGRNTTALYMLSSGTVGASLESVTCGKKSISISYAFRKKFHHVPEQIAEASRLSVQLVQHLYDNWASDVDLYSINVPLHEGLGSETKIVYAPVLQNRWGSIFDQDVDDGRKHFRWNPDFKACAKSVEESEPGNDGWVVDHNMISVSAMRAAYQQSSNAVGEIKLQEEIVACIDIDPNSYLYPLWINALASVGACSTHKYGEEGIKSHKRIVHYAEYDDLDFDRLGASDPGYLACSYIYRKGLIRKHYLTHTVQMFTAKNPDSILKRAYPDSYHIEVDYAEFLDDALDEAFELRGEIDGEKTWILKPSMSDRGQGIRIFKTIDQLQEIFDSFEQDEDEDEDENENEGDGNDHRPDGEENLDNHGVITSQMRHFVVQRYLENPLLVPEHGNRKFHIRTYGVASGAIKMYVYRHMLALFSATKYSAPGEADGEIDLKGHLTNTCLQGEDKAEGSVEAFWDLKGVSEEMKNNIYDQICSIVRDLFKAAVSVDRINFQPITSAFEFYGIDFLVDSSGAVSVLEINAYPDFKQTGDDLQQIVQGLLTSVAKQIIGPYFGIPGNAPDLTEVLDQPMGY